MSVWPVYISDPEPGGRYVLLRANVPAVLDRYPIPVMWSAIRRGWWLRRERVSDFEARAAEAGVPVKDRRDAR